MLQYHRQEAPKKHTHIDSGREFDFGRTSENYARYRDIYPQSMYDKLICHGIGKDGQTILDLGSGTGVVALHLAETGAHITATDISENQIAQAKQTAAEKGIDNITFKVCGAEDTGFPDSAFDAVTAVQCFHYFDAEKAADEIRRVLKPCGLFCKIFMDWLPYEDDILAEMEALVLKYNPTWNGGGFREFSYTFPDWARDKFELKSVESYDAILEFTKEAWLGRVLSCRGVGASLSPDEVARFEQEYRSILEKYDEPLHLKHQIHLELYRSTKSE